MIVHHIWLSKGVAQPFDEDFETLALSWFGDTAQASVKSVLNVLRL